MIQQDPRISIDADLVVVGNGVVGLSTALACRHLDPDQRILLIGPSHRPGAASPAAAAMLAAASEVRPSTFDDPGMTSWIELVCEAVRHWPEWLAEVAERSRVPSSLVPHITRGIAVVGNEHDSGFDAILHAVERFGSMSHRIDIEEVGLLRTDIPKRCLLIEEEGGIDPVELLRFLDHCIDAVGIERLDGRVRRVEAGRVILESGSLIRADQILIASGSDCHRLLDPECLSFQKLPRIGFSQGVGLRGRPRLEQSIPGHAIRTPNRNDGSNLYLVPHGDGRVYIGATTTLEDRPRLEPLPHEIATIRCAADRMLAPDVLNDSYRPVIGSRPVSADGLPVIGELGDGLWIATGTDRDGLSAAPELSRRLAASISGTTDRIPACFKPSSRTSSPSSRTEIEDQIELC